MRTIKANVGALGLGGAEVVADRVERCWQRPVAPGRPPMEPYDIVFADPPYAVSDDEVIAVLDAAAGHGWLGWRLVAVERETQGKAADMA